MQRGWFNSGDSFDDDDARLEANTSAAEEIGVGSGQQGYPTPTGFTYAGDFGRKHIYCAIRAPQKKPVNSSEVFNAVADSHTQSSRSITEIGFSPDLMLNGVRSNANYGQHLIDRLRGVRKNLYTEYTSAENTQNGSALLSFDMDGISVGADSALT